MKNKTAKILQLNKMLYKHSCVVNSRILVLVFVDILQSVSLPKQVSIGLKSKKIKIRLFKSNFKKIIIYLGYRLIWYVIKNKRCN